MELKGLDAGFHMVKMLRCVNIQWNRRYYQAGDFAIQLRMEDWDPAIAYIYTPQRPEMGMVEKVETEHNIKGDFVNVSGFFLEGLLNWKVIKAFVRVKEQEEYATDVAQALVNQFYLQDSNNPPLIVDAASPLGELDIFSELEGQFLGDATYAILQLQEISQRVRYDYDTDTLHYQIWRGLDRTQSQNVNPYAVFSQNFGTVDGLTLTQDSSAYRNCAFVVYGDDVRDSVEDRPEGEPKRWIYMYSALNEADYSTTAKFKAAVRNEAMLALQDYKKLVNIEATVLQNNFFYLTDYDLGDKCDVQDDRLGLAFETRIIEINEVWKNNAHEVSLQFGDKIPTVYQRGRT